MTFNSFRLFNFIGTGAAILTILYTAWRYRGRQGERYSLLNHFISELGEVGVSSAARTFNLGLIFAGLVLVPYMLGLGLAFDSLLGWLGTAAGIVAALGVAAVGFFPMNNLTPHARAAMTYFRAGLIMVFLFGLAIFLQPAGHVTIPKWTVLLSLLVFVVYAVFLTAMTLVRPESNPAYGLDPQALPDRPRYWPLAVLEWAVFFATILWLFGMSFFI